MSTDVFDNGSMMEDMRAKTGLRSPELHDEIVSIVEAYGCSVTEAMQRLVRESGGLVDPIWGIPDETLGIGPGGDPEQGDEEPVLTEVPEWENPLE